MSGFQLDAFQGDAFQVISSAGVVAPAFQRSAFQNDAFQTQGDVQPSLGIPFGTSHGQPVTVGSVNG